MADRTVFVITDGKKYKCFFEGIESDIQDFETRDGISHNAYALYGGFCEKWLTINKFSIEFVVSKVIEGKL